MKASSALLLAVWSDPFPELQLHKAEMEEDEQIGANLMINRERVKLHYN